MDQNTWNRLTSHESLLAIGVTLIMTGIILRGFARNARRDLARRKQHQLDERKSAAATLNTQMDRPPSWFDQHASLVANATLIAGLMITLVAFFRK